MSRDTLRAVAMATSLQTPKIGPAWMRLIIAGACNFWGWTVARAVGDKVDGWRDRPPSALYRSAKAVSMERNTGLSI